MEGLFSLEICLDGFEDCDISAVFTRRVETDDIGCGLSAHIGVFFFDSVRNLMFNKSHF